MLTRRSLLCAAAFSALALLPAWAAADTTLDLSKMTRVTLPAAGDAPVAFKTPDGKEGWVRRLSGETIPTPAYSNGRIFTGGGMGSRLFMALDALTGQTIWQQTTTDNGPTSAIVSDNTVSYNTESCDTEIRDIISGNMLWHETTGGSLLTQPVVADGLLVIPHPTMERKAQMADDAFRILAVDLKTSKHAWDRNMTADVLGAPVAAGGRVFFTCTDGRLFCMSTVGMQPGWHIVANATSAPVVVGDIVAVTTEEKKMLGGAVVSIRRYNADDGELKDNQPLAPTTVSSASTFTRQAAQWDYQGPKVAAAGKQLFNAPGQTINSVDLESGKTLWRTTITGNGLSNAANSLTPPALGKKNLYLGSIKGDVLGIKQSDGSLAFCYNVGQPLASQPILAGGNLYLGTANGYLVCLKLENPDAQNWHAWGGDAQHNKVD